MKPRVIFVLPLFLISLCQCLYSQEPQCAPLEITGRKLGEPAVRSRFRYVIVSGVTELEQYVNRNPQRLNIEVLLEDGAFNEGNLRCLFQLLSNRFTDRRGLYVWVYTTLDAIKTPEENDRSDLKGPINNVEKFKHAFFGRNDKCDSWFSYSIPGVVRNKYIILPCI
jgi:hypothetical protein